MKKYFLPLIFFCLNAIGQTQSGHLTPGRLQTIPEMKGYSNLNGSFDFVYVNSVNKIFSLCTSCVPDEKTIFRGYTFRVWKMINTDKVDTISISGSNLIYTIEGRSHSIVLPSGGGGGLTGSYTVHQYLNGYLNFVTFNTDSIPQGVANLYNQTHTGDATGATALTVVGIRNNIIPSLSVGNLKWSGSAWIFDNTAYLTSITANNGLTASTGSNIQLGGTFIQNTSINAAHFFFKLDSASKISLSVSNDSLLTKIYAARDTLQMIVGSKTSTSTVIQTTTKVLAGVNSTTFLIKDDTAKLTDPFGNFFIDYLTTGVLTDSFMVWNSGKVKKIFLGVFSSTDNGLVPNSSGAATGAFLRKDGVWAVPSGTGGGMTSWDVADSAGTTKYSISDATKLLFATSGNISVTFPGTNTIYFSVPTNLSSFVNGPGFITNSAFIIANSSNVTQFSINTNNKFQLSSGGIATNAFDAGNKRWTVTVPATLSSFTNDPNFISLLSLSASSPISYNNSTGLITHNTSGVGAGTYNNVTVDIYGHVTGGSNATYITSEVDPLSVHIQTSFFTPQTGSFDVSGTGIANIFRANQQIELSDGFGGTGIIHAANPLTGTRVLNFPNMTGVIPMDVNGQFADLNGLITLNTDNISEGSTNKYYTDARARAAISLTTTGSGAATYNNSTGVLNIPTNGDTNWFNTDLTLGADRNHNGNNHSFIASQFSNIYFYSGGNPGDPAFSVFASVGEKSFMFSQKNGTSNVAYVGTNTSSGGPPIVDIHLDGTDAAGSINIDPKVGNLRIFNIPTYADNTAAASLVTGTVYKTSTGQLMIKY